MDKALFPGLPPLSDEYEVSTELPAEAGDPDGEGFIAADGVYLRSGNVWLHSRKDNPETRDLLRVLRFFRGQEKEISGPYTAEDVWLRLLTEDVTPENLKEWRVRFRIRSDKPRCVLLFSERENIGTVSGAIPMTITGKTRENRKQSLFQILQEVAPTETGDVLLRLSQNQVVLLKELHEADPWEESEDYALALRETLESEVGTLPDISMGLRVNGPEKIRESYLQALQALEVGKRFYPEETVYFYHRLILEIFLSGLPKEKLDPWRERFQSPAIRKMLTEEMLETVRMFFRLDLNISDTARQMFIHRNTLNYRLEKIQRVTGLDLRKFEDAVIFRLFMDLPEY